MSWIDDRPAIEAHYAEGVEEQRLSTIARFEHLRLSELLGRYLPAAPAKIADVGGGPGTYALPLARAGYSVHLLDAMPRHVERARELSDQEPAAARLRSAHVGNAVALPWAAQEIDTCLFFGPLYHLTAASEREAALREAHRVLRPGGVLLASGISRFASVYAGLIRGFLAEPAFRTIADRDLREGQHRNPNGHPRWFTTAYYHRPEALAEEIADAGFLVKRVLAVDGPAGCLTDLGWWLDHDDRRETLLATVRAVEGEPSLLGASPQFLVVACKRS